MKQASKIFFLVIVLSVFQQCQCQKEDQQKPKLSCDGNTVFLPQLAKDIFVFKQGTWWMYANINNGIRDSFYVFTFTDLTGNNDIYSKLVDVTKLHKCYEFYQVKIKSNQLGQINKEVEITIPSDNDSYRNRLFQVFESNQVSNSGYIKVNFQGDSTYPSQTLQNNIYYQDSIKIQGNWFYQVLVIENAPGTMDYFLRGYFVKGIGLVKYTLTDNTDWEMVSKNIVQ